MRPMIVRHGYLFPLATALGETAEVLTVLLRLVAELHAVYANRPAYRLKGRCHVLQEGGILLFQIAQRLFHLLLRGDFLHRCKAILLRVCPAQSLVGRQLLLLDLLQRSVSLNYLLVAGYRCVEILFFPFVLCLHDLSCQQTEGHHDPVSTLPLFHNNIFI